MYHAAVHETSIGSVWEGTGNTLAWSERQMIQGASYSSTNRCTVLLIHI